ncbi:MAG: hypothetical protein K9L32_05290 [Chromatiaceae bacterium]|nr:hypothetical protein [Chromatiaceae bacterium]
MAHFADLLGSVIQNNLGPSGQQRIGNALQDLQANYLRQFAAKTGLHPAVVQTIHQTMGVVAV